MSDGLVVVDKPADWTSHDVVARTRRLAGTRKVGHAGTLDPMATGVLVLGVGRATRLLGQLTLTDKEYTATIRLGAATTTDDAQGETLTGSEAVHLDRSAVDEAISRFRGEIEQVPSSVSAIKVGGRRAYAAVRAGEDVELAARKVRVDRFEVLAVHERAPFLDVDVEVTCSSGTYVRALARDVGDRLSVGGHLTALRRTRAGPFGLGDARTLEALAERFVTLDLGSAAARCFPTVTLDDDAAGRVRHGRPLPGTPLGASGPVALFDPEGGFLALYEQAGTTARAVAVFV